MAIFTGSLRGMAPGLQGLGEAEGFINIPVEPLKAMELDERSGGAGEALGPSPRLKKLYWTYASIASAAYVLTVVLPVFLVMVLVPEARRTVMLIFLSALLIPLLIALGITAYWINAFYASLSYRLGPRELVVRKGVWWRKESIVPYDRITNLTVVQGPISRALGLYTVRVQTAGLHARGAGVPVAEAELLGIEDPGDVVARVMERVRALRPAAVEAGPEDVWGRMLAELRRIRELLERERPGGAG